MTRHDIFWPILFLALTSPVAADDCREVAGLDALLQPTSVVLVGEMHGTHEMPAAVSEIVCQALAAKLKVTLALELPQDDQALLDTYLASGGTAADRAAFLTSPFWSSKSQDGRASTAMLRLIDDSRRRKQAGEDLEVILLDRPQAMQQRDQVMADRLVEAVEAAPDRFFVALMGNLHNRVSQGSGRLGEWAAQALPTVSLTSLLATYTGGSAWVCLADGCGPHDLAGRPSDAVAPNVSLGSQSTHYDGTLFVGAITSSAPALAPAAVDEGPPKTPKERVVDTYHGVEVADDYRWLEDGEAPAVREWSAAQNAYARSVLDALPYAEEIRARLSEMYHARASRFRSLSYRGGRLFALKLEPPKQRPFLVVMPSADEPEKGRTLVDPNAIGGGTSIDWYVASPDGRRVAVSLSRHGTGIGDLYLYDTATGEQVGDVIPRVNSATASGDVAWSRDGSGFYYTRSPRSGERPPEELDFYQQVYFHQLGTPIEEDRYELGEDLPSVAEIRLDVDPWSGRVLATVQEGDGGEFALYLRSTDGTWQQFSHFGDQILDARFGPRDQLYLISRRGGPRGEILRLPMTELDVAKATVLIPEEKDSVVYDFYSTPTVVVTDHRIYVVYQLGGPSEIRAFDLRGESVATPRQLPVSSVSEIVRLAGGDILFGQRSYTVPGTYFHFDPASGETRETALKVRPPVDSRGVEVVRELANSKDGTQVPVNILLPAGVRRDGTNPCVVTGYGGFGLSLTPSFNANLYLYLEEGVIYAIANLRGGSEFGEGWHEGGRLTRRQNVYDDMAGVLQHLVDRRYTSPERLGIVGGSNGGLLMGAVLTQHPELVKAVVSWFGTYDMVRAELSPNGAFNIPEYGTVREAQQFAALYAYSPYHRVEDGVRYPATLFLTGANDRVVDPMHSRKMTARLQAATASPAPILLRTSADTGHSRGTPLDERIAQMADQAAFFFAHLGVKLSREEGAKR